MFYYLKMLSCGRVVLFYIYIFFNSMSDSLQESFLWSRLMDSFIKKKINKRLIHEHEHDGKD